MMVVGRTGAGKTTFFYNVMDALTEKGVPFMAFDFKNDLSTKNRLNTVQEENRSRPRDNGRRAFVHTPLCMRGLYPEVAGVSDGACPEVPQAFLIATLCGAQ